MHPQIRKRSYIIKTRMENVISLNFDSKRIGRHAIKMLQVFVCRDEKTA